jgi:hypothetical protein
MDPQHWLLIRSHFDPGSGIKKIRIRDQHPGSATLETRNHLGDGLDLGAELLLDPVQGESIIVGDQVDRHTQVSEPTRKNIMHQVVESYRVGLNCEAGWD